MAAKEVSFSTDARERMLRGVAILSNAVQITLGPKGRNMIIEKSYVASRTTKDGVTVTKEIGSESRRRMFAARQLGASTTAVSPRGIAMNSFDYCAGAELLINKPKRSRRRPVGYERFARAADAIRFLIKGLDRREPRPTPSPEQGPFQSEASPAARKPLWWSRS